MARAAARIEHCPRAKSFNVLACRPCSPRLRSSSYRRFLVVHPVRVLAPAFPLSGSCARLSGAPSRTLLASLSLRSAGRLEPFLSAGALLCGSSAMRFPIGAVARCLPASRPLRVSDGRTPFAGARAARAPLYAGAGCRVPPSPAPPLGRCFS